MHRRHQRTNIPTEIVRTIVAIADTGSFTKAGDKLDLSQAAISAQVKRFELLVGASAFERIAGGVRLTDRGTIALASARKMLDANDQLVRLGGNGEQVPIRVGLSIYYAERFMQTWRNAQLAVPPAIFFDLASNIQRAFHERTIDIACVIGAFAGAGELVDHWEEEFVWARGRDFLLSPGAPIPLIDWPHSPSNDVAVRALEHAGLTYRLSIVSVDYHATVIAVAAGAGLVAIPRTLLAPPLIQATEYYLPSLSAMHAGIYAREGFESADCAPLIDLLRLLRPPAPLPTPLRHRGSAGIASDLIGQSKSKGSSQLKMPAVIRNNR